MKFQKRYVTKDTFTKREIMDWIYEYSCKYLANDINIHFLEHFNIEEKIEQEDDKEYFKRLLKINNNKLENMEKKLISKIEAYFIIQQNKKARNKKWYKIFN